MSYQPCPVCHNIYNSGRSCEKCGRSNICSRCGSLALYKFCGNCGFCVDVNINSTRSNVVLAPRNIQIYSNPYNPSEPNGFYNPNVYYPPYYPNFAHNYKYSTEPTEHLTQKDKKFYIDESRVTQTMIKCLEPIYKSNQNCVKIIILYDGNLKRAYPNLSAEIQNIQYNNNYDPVHVFVIYLIGTNEDRDATRYVRQCLPECKVNSAYFNPYIAGGNNTDSFVINTIDQTKAFYLIEPARY